MTWIKILLVLLLCVPVAFVIWCFVRNISNMLKRQEKAAEERRKNKEMFRDRKARNNHRTYERKYPRDRDRYMLGNPDFDVQREPIDPSVYRFKNPQRYRNDYAKRADRQQRRNRRER